ncbi:MAG: GAF domain-containing protein [Bacteroidota bacterium]|nr:GAF domain-containing protein [Bacteroidota bacterium]
MIKRTSNIIFYLFLAVSIATLVIYFGYYSFDEKIELYIYPAFIGVAIIVAFVFKLFIRKTLKILKVKKIEVQQQEIIDNEKETINIEKNNEIDDTNKIAINFINNLEIGDNMKKTTENILKNFSQLFNIVQGVFFTWNDKEKLFKTANTYAFYSTETEKKFSIGEGLTGQVAKNKKVLLIDNVPKNYINVASGLGEGTPKYLVLIPIISNNNVLGVIELASFIEFPPNAKKIFSQIAMKIADLLKNYISFESK